MRKSTEMDKYRAQAMASTGGVFNECNAEGRVPQFLCGCDFLIFKVNKHRLNMHCVLLLFFLLMEAENDDFQRESPLPGIERDRFSSSILLCIILSEYTLDSDFFLCCAFLRYLVGNRLCV